MSKREQAPEADYAALCAAAEDVVDVAALGRFRQSLATGEEELIPIAVTKRLVAGRNPVRVWRQHRNLSVARVAELAGISARHLSAIETGSRNGSIETLAAIAEVLGVEMQDLIRRGARRKRRARRG